MRRRSLRNLHGEYTIVLKDRTEIYATVSELDESGNEAFLVYRPIPQGEHSSNFQWPDHKVSSRIIRNVYL